MEATAAAKAMGPRGRAGRLERDRRDEAERELGPHARRHGARLRVEARVPGLALGRVEERADARADEDAEVVARAARPRVAALEHGRPHDAHERAVDLEVVLAPVEDDGDVVPRVVVDDDVAVHGADPADVVERASAAHAEDGPRDAPARLVAPDAVPDAVHGRLREDGAAAVERWDLHARRQLEARALVQRQQLAGPLAVREAQRGVPPRRAVVSEDGHHAVGRLGPAAGGRPHDLARRCGHASGGRLHDLAGRCGQATGGRLHDLARRCGRTASGSVPGSLGHTTKGSQHVTRRLAVSRQWHYRGAPIEQV